MPRDMKEMIAEAVRILLFEKKVKKLTVKDIVQECQITRQAFYYHFEDIPELLKWILERESEKLEQECMKQEEPEDRLRYFFSVAVSMKADTERGLQTNYGEEIEKILRDYIYHFFQKAMENSEFFKVYSNEEQQIMLRYHCLAIIGILRSWTKEDSKNMDSIVHQIYEMMQGKMRVI